MALTDEVSGETLLNLINPFSVLYGSPTWAPKFIRDMNINPEATEAIWKGITGLVGAGAIAGALRLYQGIKDRNTTFTTKPMTKYLDTTQEAPISRTDLDEARKRQTMGKTASGYGDWATVALPAAGVIGGSVLGYNLVDRLVEKYDSWDYDKKIKEKSELLKRLVAARALQARGLLPEANYKALTEAAEGQTKTASVSKKAGIIWEWLNSPIKVSKGVAGLLMLLTAATSAYMAKNYFDENDPDRIKAKAMKKGLEAYSKERMFDKPMFMASPENALFNALNTANVKESKGIPGSAVSLTEVPQPPVSIPL